MRQDRLAKLAVLKKVAAYDWNKVNTYIDDLINLQTGVDTVSIKTKIQNIINEVFRLPSSQATDEAGIKSAIKQRFDADDKLDWYSDGYAAKQQKNKDKFENLLTVSARYILGSRSSTETGSGSTANREKGIVNIYNNLVNDIRFKSDHDNKNTSIEELKMKQTKAVFGDKDLSLYASTSNPDMYYSIKPNVLSKYVGKTVNVSELLTIAGAYGAKKSPQATGPTAEEKTKLILPIGQTVKDDWGSYTATGEYSFDYVSKDNKKGSYDSSKSGWEESAKKINGYAKEQGKASEAQAPTAQTQTPAATTPAAGEAAKPVVSETNPIAVKNVQAVLARAGDKALAFWTRQNEKGRIKEMVADIKNLWPNQNISDDVALKALASVVYTRNETLLEPYVGKADISAAIATAEARDLKVSKRGTYSAVVSAVLNAMNKIYEEKDTTSGYFRKMMRLQEQPAANTQTNAQQEAGQQPTVVMAPSTKDGGPKFFNEEEKKKFEQKQKESLEQQAAKKTDASRVDPRIKKLATLRRLRVRSQMEAATESSAQFGRSRVS